jgi:hypothetical protein
MQISFRNTYRQAIAILDSGSEGSRGYSIARSVSSAPDFVNEVIGTENHIVKTYFSSVPVIWKSELNEEYRELGEALSEMIALEDEDEWRIDTSVYSAATYVASELKAYKVPAPRLFSHGPHSVVFNWSNTSDNLYLTISANRVSALLSSPERIVHRIEYSPDQLPNPVLLVLPYTPTYMTPPIIPNTESNTDLSDVIG